MKEKPVRNEICLWEAPTEYSLTEKNLLALLLIIILVKRVCVLSVNAEQQYCDVHMD